jgi:uncharacterized protein (TIGR03437 family)
MNTGIGVPLLLIAAAGGGACLWAQAPEYSAENVVNSANGRPGELAPNTIATIYGKNLADAVAVINGNQIKGGTLPVVLPPSGARVSVGGLATALYYASPTQINFLVPAMWQPGDITVQVFRDSWVGPKVTVHLYATSPAIFQFDATYAAATHADGSLLKPESPATPGEVIVLYATGLGPTRPAFLDLELATTAATVTTPVEVLVDGQAVPAADVQYAGVTPGYAGLYQVNVRLPATLATNTPEVRLVQVDRWSGEGVRIPARPN